VDGSRFGGPSEVVTVSESPGIPWKPSEQDDDTGLVESDSEEESGNGLDRITHRPSDGPDPETESVEE
jgi:hypothetical protein